MFQRYLHELKVNEYPEEDRLDEISDKGIEHYLAFLPVLYDCLSTTNDKYYIIEANWMALDEKTNIVIGKTY